MYRSRIPVFAKIFLPEIICRPDAGGTKTVYLTFDDGPIPESTPYIIDTLNKYGLKATFFCVGENVKKHPELYSRIVAEGNYIGNHTFNHLNGWKTDLDEYLYNVEKGASCILSNLFRPPYGKMTLSQYKVLRNQYKLIFWDVLVPDYDANTSAQECLEILKKKTRAGSILVFHDNLKAKNKLTELLPATLDFLLQEGYDIQPVTNNISK